jgi:hypothetical protein
MTCVRVPAIIALLALLPVACSGQGPPAESRVVVAPAAAPEKAREEVRDLLVDVREAKTLAGVVGEKAVREKLELALLRAERRAENLERLLAAVGPAGPAALAGDEFAQLLKSVKAESFDNRRVPIVKDATRHAHFTCAQAADLVKAMSFGEGRTTTAIALHPRLVDPVNFHRVLAAMQFDSEKDTVRKALKLDK